ncbi:MAG: bifunctional DNA-formamidopyrimidine glycosylase/DNA-(apurinic or apyrimidinic site) lyase [Candidatus Pacebacteria bacterium]|nr:bifunctional DNA-formamidopyrimidine glycosylase/DNA-(apurinic or apyrimidinic site) lyase [Candidatus Paceibacterota bacterium]
MPELPEVEIISQGLDKSLKGKSFSKIQILDKNRFIGNPNILLNKKIKKVYRRAKLVIFEFEKDIYLLAHLKMTGQFIYIDGKKKIAGGHISPELVEKVPNKHTRIIFFINKDQILYFNDLIRYSWLKIVNKKEIDNILKKEFGVEPLSEEFNIEVLKEIIKKSKNSNIKRVLTDQKKIAGIGNIYSDEILYNAGINPQRKAQSLTAQEIKRLFNSIKKVLLFAIEKEGSSIKNYVNSEGKRGTMQDYLKIYGKDGEKCKKCGSIIKKIKLNGRGTHFCPNCQPIK